MKISITVANVLILRLSLSVFTTVLFSIVENKFGHHWITLSSCTKWGYVRMKIIIIMIQRLQT